MRERAGSMMRGVARLASAVLLTLATGCGGGSREPVAKIGLVVPLTGDQAPHGRHMLNGAQLALDQALAEGPIVPGMRVELLSLDDQRSPTQAVAAAKKLISDPAVVAVVGHLNSSCTMPASAVYHQARLLQVSPVSSNPQISRQGFDTFYRVCATDDLQGPAAALFGVRELGAQRIFIIDDMTTYGRGLANEYKKKLEELGVEVLGHEGITQGDKDFLPLLTKIKGLAPDLVYFAGMFPEAALLIKQRRDIGLDAHFMGGDGLYEPTLIELATPEAAEGIYLTTIGSDVKQIPTAQEFVAAYEQRFGPIGAYSSYTYEAMSIAIWALRQAAASPEFAPAKPAARRAAVLAAMKTLHDFPGLFGLQSFDERGDTTNRDIGLFTIHDGKFAFLKTASWE
jgi:branched-chain amino acid transport system substrate-binding protein